MHVLLPIKNLNFAKQRLASLLSATERRRFFQAMLHDVLTVLNTHPLIDGITLVSDDPSTQALSQEYQLTSISQVSLNAQGLSNTIKAGVAFLGQNGIKHAMILHGDLPLINAAEVSELISRYSAATQATITLTPDRRGTGTNSIICPTQSAFEFHYGEYSFEKHRAQALLYGINTQIVKQAGISCDIDYPNDLLQFLIQARSNNSVYTQRFLRDNKIIDRLFEQATELSAATRPPRLANVINIATKQAHKNYAR